MKYLIVTLLYGMRKFHLKDVETTFKFYFGLFSVSGLQISKFLQI